MSNEDKIQNMESEDTKNDQTTNKTVNTGKMFTLKKWNAVAMWSWDVVVENCAICRSGIMNMCIECQVSNNSKSAQNECELAWGECNHSFHLHCIQKWLQTRQVCPLDNLEWEFQEIKLQKS